jgi:hypothetical protein
MEHVLRQAADDLRELETRGLYCKLNLRPCVAWTLLGTLRVLIQQAVAESPLHDKILQQIVADLEFYFRAYPALNAAAALRQDPEFTLQTS